MYPKIKFTAKTRLTYALIFRFFCLRNYFFFIFFAKFELMMFHNNIVKISENLN